MAWALVWFALLTTVTISSPPPQLDPARVHPRQSVPTFGELTSNAELLRFTDAKERELVFERLLEARAEGLLALVAEFQFDDWKSRSRVVPLALSIRARLGWNPELDRIMRPLFAADLRDAPDLLLGLQSTEASTRLRAAAALRSLGPPVIPLLIEYVERTECAAAGRILRQLGDGVLPALRGALLDREAVELVPVLEGMGRDGAAVLREGLHLGHLEWAVIRSLGRMGADAIDAVPDLEAVATRGCTYETRSAARAAARQIEDDWIGQSWSRY